MKVKGKEEHFSELRNLSEKILADDHEEIKNHPPKYTDGLIHELQVNQIELELQNEELRGTQIELERSHNKYFNLFNFAPIGFFVLDEKTVIHDVNAVGEELLGVNKAYITGKKFTEFIASESQDMFYLHFKEVFLHHEKKISELKLKRRDGSIFYAELISLPQEDSETKLSKLQIAVADISERKHAEEKLLLSKANLKSLASQLVLAEEKERRRLAMTLHDNLIQPLFISKLRLDMAKNCKHLTEVIEFVNEARKIIEQTINESASLVSNMSSPILHMLGLEDAVDNLLSREIYEKHHIMTTFENDDELKPLGDDIKIVLFRDIRELLMNVVKHAQATKVKVSIHRVGDNISIDIEDNGHGFDVEKTAAAAIKKGKFGLFSVREQLEQLGGSLEIVSRINQGCKFTMTAPLMTEITV